MKTKIWKSEPIGVIDIMTHNGLEMSIFTKEKVVERTGLYTIQLADENVGPLSF
jgi:hypothetical protein